jgi:hypothetical protein
MVGVLGNQLLLTFIAGEVVCNWQLALRGHSWLIGSGAILLERPPGLVIFYGTPVPAADQIRGGFLPENAPNTATSNGGLRVKWIAIGVKVGITDLLVWLLLKHVDFAAAGALLRSERERGPGGQARAVRQVLARPPRIIDCDTSSR